jgi:methylase of polypeptide subunit release factors
MTRKLFLEKIKINKKKTIKLFISKKIFTPNLTTNLLVDACNKIINKNKKVLELGCGSGIISSYLYKKKIINKIYCSDISEQAIMCSVKNAKYLKAKYEIKISNLFDNWKDESFDYIINDVSAISESLNKMTNWYKYTTNQSGIDGTKFTIEILKTFKNHLKKKGSLIFPIIGLSNKYKILNFMKEKKIKNKLVAFQEWPLPKEFYKYKKKLLDLNKKKIIQIEEKLGFLTTKTDIYQCF